MWFIYAATTLLLWAIADVFYKKGAKKEDKYSHLKTGVAVGWVMGIYATVYLIVEEVTFNIVDIAKYLPVSLFYIASMIIGYKGLRYIELSISSPIQNSSGIITSVLLFIIFREKLQFLDILGIIIIGIGITCLSILENKKDSNMIDRKTKNGKKIVFVAILFPLIYCILDGAGTFLDAIYLDKLEIISENVALVAYEYTFFVYGLFCLIYLKFFKKEEIGFIKVKQRLGAAIFETLGQVTYVFAMSDNSTLSAPIVASYSIMSVLLSRVFLKERLKLKEYIAIFIVLFGVVLLGISEGLE